MSLADIRNVAAYFSGLAPLKLESTTEDLSIHEKGKAAAKTCAGCHGEDGNSTTAGIPSLAGQQPVYIISAVKSYLDGKRKMSSKEKEAMVKVLNQVDIEAMAVRVIGLVDKQAWQVDLVTRTHQPDHSVC